MIGYFTAQLDLQRQTAGGECSRSDECLESGAVFETWRDNHTLERCPACNRPRSIVMPPHLSDAAGVAVRFDCLKEGGARFAYPESLTPFEWAAIESLQRARQSDQRKDQKQQSEGAERQIQIEELERATGKR